MKKLLLSRSFTLMLFVFAVAVGCTNKEVVNRDTSLVTTTLSPSVTSIEKNESNIKTREYNINNLGLSLVFPESWVDRYRIIEAETSVTVCFKPNVKIEGSKGRFFTILKKTKDSDEWHFDDVERFVANGITYIIGKPTDVTYTKEDPEFDAFKKMQAEVPEVLKTLKANKQISEILPIAANTPLPTFVPVIKNEPINLNIKENDLKPLIILKDKIHPSLPEYLFKVFGERKGSTIYANKIDIYKISEKEEKIQEIIFSDARTLDDRQIGTYIEDMNFDGYKDIRVQCGTPPGPNIPYFYWLWDKDSSEYKKNKELEELTSPEFDYVNKVITSFNRGSVASYREREYKYIDKRLTLIKETERVAAPEIKGWHVTIKELINNELQVTKKFDEAN